MSILCGSKLILKNADFNESARFIHSASVPDNLSLLFLTSTLWAHSHNLACSPEVTRNVIEGLGFSKDSSWLPALSDSSVLVFTFWSDLDRKGALHADCNVCNDYFSFSLITFYFCMVHHVNSKIHKLSNWWKTHHVFMAAIQLNIPKDDVAPRCKYLCISAFTFPPFYFSHHCFYHSQLYWHNGNRPTKCSVI